MPKSFGVGQTKTLCRIALRMHTTTSRICADASVLLYVCVRMKFPGGGGGGVCRIGRTSPWVGSFPEMGPEWPWPGCKSISSLATAERASKTLGSRDACTWAVRDARGMRSNQRLASGSEHLLACDKESPRGACWDCSDRTRLLWETAAGLEGVCFSWHRAGSAEDLPRLACGSSLLAWLPGSKQSAEVKITGQPTSQSGDGSSEVCWACLPSQRPSDLSSA